MRRLLGIICTIIIVATCIPARAAYVYVREEFSANPFEGDKWIYSRGWNWWDWGLLSSPDKVCTALWRPNLFGRGNYGGRIRLLASGGAGPARAEFIFCWSRTFCGTQYYHVTLAAGSPGRVSLGKRWRIGTTSRRKILASVPAEILLGEWYEIDIFMHFFGDVEISLAAGSNVSKKVLEVHAPDPQFRRGRAGFRTVMTRAQSDDFWVVQEDGPKTEYCAYCHSGYPPALYSNAPNVMTYWDGTWWNGGNPQYQQGGHGDPGGRPALNCTGSTGCHNMGESAESHADGNRHDTEKGADHRTRNTYHLRRGFINQAPVNPWDVQVTFDNFCSTACHRKNGVKDMHHDRDGLPAPNATQFGTHQTLTDADNSSPRFPYPIDSDLTTLKPKPAAEPPYDEDYAPCVACHDPHGTGTLDSRGHPPLEPNADCNRMLRENWMWSGDLCYLCHW